MRAKREKPICYNGDVEWEKHSAPLFNIVERTMTKKQLLRFVKTRNASGFASNLQFQIDAEACGFRCEELGEGRRVPIQGTVGYEWTVKTKDAGTIRLVEFLYKLFVEGEPNATAIFAEIDGKVAA